MKVKNQLFGAAIASLATFAVAAPAFSLTTLIGVDPNYPTDFDPLSPDFGLPAIRTSTISPTGIADPVTGNTSGQQKAVSFITPNSVTDPELLELNSVRLALSGLDDSDDAVVTILEGSDIETATTVLTIDDSNISPAFTNDLRFFTFTPSSTFSFSTNTTYWVNLSAEGTGAYNWVSPTDVNQSAPSGLATFNSYEFSNDGGATYANSGQFNTFTVLTNEATASVPFDFSPTTGLFLVGGLWGVNKLRRRKADAKIIED